MTTPAQFHFEYVSGAFIPFPGELWIMVANVSGEEQTVQVLGYDRRGQLVFDSMVDQPAEPPISHDPEGHVQRGETWTYYMDAPEVAYPFRVVLRTTSDRLIPSIQNRYVQQEPSGALPEVITRMVCWPDNFMRYQLHVPPVEPPVGAGGPPVFEP